MSQAPKVNVIARDNGFGLTRNLELLHGVLVADGFDVTISGIRRGTLRKALHPVTRNAGTWVRRMAGRGGQRWDVNLMLERVRPGYLAAARCNVLMPHPEWFQEQDRRWLTRLDRAFVLTHHALPIFRALGLATDYVGFTSVDRLDASVPRERSFFHLAGRSSNKGTDTLLALWCRHPEWPRLTVLQSPRVARARVHACNLDHRVDYISDAELQRIQNAHRFHLCPSETEGFGHYLVEAMSVGAVTVTLDAPPMNEMITPARGALVPYSRAGKQSLATTYYYDGVALEAAIERLLALSDVELERKGAAARAWFEDNDRAFRARIATLLQRLAG